MKQILCIAVTAAAVAGCASMSPEQMAASVKDKNAVVACGNGSGPWGKVTTVYVDTNKINDNNTVSVDSECKVTVTGTKGAAAPSPTPPAK
jgi:predicted lipoprotein